MAWGYWLGPWERRTGWRDDGDRFAGIDSRQIQRQIGGTCLRGIWGPVRRSDYVSGCRRSCDDHRLHSPVSASLALSPILLRRPDNSSSPFPIYPLSPGSTSPPSNNPLPLLYPCNRLIHLHHAKGVLELQCQALSPQESGAYSPSYSLRFPNIQHRPT